MEHELNLLCKVYPRVQTSYYKAKDGWLGKDVKWTYPPRGKYKINMDGLLIKPQNETRLVVIIRNEGEEYLQLLVKRKKLIMVSDPAEKEAKMAWRAIAFARRGIFEIIGFIIHQWQYCFNKVWGMLAR